MELPGHIYDPDMAVSPRTSILLGQSSLPRVISEVEIRNRTINGVFKRGLEYFALIPCLQAVIVFKFFSKRVNGKFAALAVLLRRNHAAVAPPFATATDAVSFGTADLSSRTHLPAGMPPVRELPNPAVVNFVAGSPWLPAQMPWITVPGSDLFHLGPAYGTLLPGTPYPVPDLIIDLWGVLELLCEVY